MTRMWGLKTAVLVTGLLVLGALLVGPVSAACTFHITKCTDSNNNGKCDPGEEIINPEWEFIITPPSGLPANCVVQDTFTSNGEAHADYTTKPGATNCAGTGYTVEEVTQTGWTNTLPGGSPPKYTGLACVANKDTHLDFANERTVPEFPTVGVSLATLVALGFMVYVVRQRKE